jgi:SM-20-related protein
MSYGGETIFTNPERTEIIHSVIPKPGRALLFDGFIPHCAREISRTCIELRMVATLKYFKNEK